VSAIKTAKTARSNQKPTDVSGHRGLVADVSTVIALLQVSNKIVRLSHVMFTVERKPERKRCGSHRLPIQNCVVDGRMCGCHGIESRSNPAPGRIKKNQAQDTVAQQLIIMIIKARAIRQHSIHFRVGEWKSENVRWRRIFGGSALVK
jgi:hypothetical protein